VISRFLKKAVAVSDGSDNEFLSLARDVSQTGSDGLIVSAVDGSNATDEASKYESNARSFQGGAAAFTVASKVLLVRHAAAHVEIAFATIKGNEAAAEPAAYPRNSAR